MDNDDGQAEQRAGYRLAAKAHLVLELEAADETAGLSARTVSAYTRDFSAGGIRIETLEAVSVGALLRARMYFDHERVAHDLVVEVVWCKPVVGAEGRWLVGLKVMESEDSAVLEWFETVAVAMADL